MKNIISVILFLASCNKKVLCRRLQPADDNVIVTAESEFLKPYSTRARGVPDIYSWGSADYDSDEQYDDSDRVIFPESDWRLHKTSTSPPQKNIRQCITSCEPGSANQPVCGTDDVTYFNLDQLECFMRCGVDVNVRRLSPCPGWTGTANIAVKSSPTTDNSQSCLLSCPTTPEYNPVCGTDNVSYKNHGKLMCAQYCGKDVQLGRRSPCPKILPSTEEPVVTTDTPRSTTLSSAVRSCIWSCPTTSEYNPVCGSNKQTYYNLSKLQCASYCGVDVSLLKSVPCHLEATESNTISEVTTTTQKSIQDHTIPQDLLDSVFNTKKDDKKYDIDIRYPE